MQSFGYLIGKRIEVSYRAGDVHMTVTGTLSFDSGHRIHLEERFSSSERGRTLRIEIPYGSIIRIRKITAQPDLQPVPQLSRFQ